LETGNERQERILQIISEKGDVQLQELKEVFPNVSIMTLRRDLINLENSNHVIRTHGGAVSIKKFSYTQEDSYSLRESEHIDSKRRVAEKIVAYVEKGRSLYFDAGTTIMCLSRILPQGPLTIITSGVNIGLEILKNSDHNVFILGGLINHNTLSVSGPAAINYIEDMNIDIAFMAASGFSLESGFTNSNIYENELKKKVIQKAKKVIMLLDSSKISKNMPFTFATLEDIDVLAYEGTLPSEYIEKINKLGIELLY
jgi:DeoR/GlpR family transcriptional regulator of sugar metabolism